MVTVRFVEPKLAQSTRPTDKLTLTCPASMVVLLTLMTHRSYRNGAVIINLE